MRSIDFYSPNDNREEIASKVASLETGYAKLYITGRGVADVRFPMIVNPFRMTPRFGTRKMESHLARIREQPAFQNPEILSAYQAVFFGALQDYLNKLHAHQRPERSALEAIAHNPTEGRNEPMPCNAPGSDNTEFN